jgi:hypothetical protein
MRWSTSAFLLILGVGPVLTGYASAEEGDPTHERIITALNACGVPRAKVRITYEDELQSEFVRIGDLGGSDEARFQCVRKVIFPAYIVDLSAAPQGEAYYAFDRREGAKLARAEAVEWLKTRGLLDRVPRYDARKGLKAFARALETACSIRPGSVFETHDSSGLTIRRSFFGDSMTSDVHDQLTCLLQMESASNAQQHGINFGFVGNEAYQTENQP